MNEFTRLSFSALCLTFLSSFPPPSSFTSSLFLLPAPFFLHTLHTYSALFTGQTQTTTMPLITSEQATEAALKQEGIIPDVLDSFHPKTILMVSYGSNNEVALGNTLSVEDTQQAPQVSFQAESPSDQYTLIMTDPDAPSRKDPKMREYRHWVVANISGTSDFQPANVAQGAVVSSYMGPAPPAGSGPHRYIFLLYKQTPSTNISALTTPLGSHRQGFKAKHFSSQAHLELVGANYFFAENP